MTTTEQDARPLAYLADRLPARAPHRPACPEGSIRMSESSPTLLGTLLGQTYLTTDFRPRGTCGAMLDTYDITSVDRLGNVTGPQT